MRKFVLKSVMGALAALTLSGCESALEPDNADWSAAGFAAIDAHYAKAVEARELPGAAVLIAHRGEVVFERHYGFADIEAARPLADDALFRIYSMTKPVVAAATLQLVEKGLLSLDDAVAEFLPELASPMLMDGTPARAVMTVRDLLTHEAGYSAAWGGDAQGELLADAHVWETVPVDPALRADLPADLEAFIARIATVPLAHQPGARMTYGLSSDVLGAVIERASGQTLDRYLAENIFEPLGMMDTAFCVSADKAPRLATLYAYDADRALQSLDRPATSVRQCPVGVFSGGSGLVSTPRDYLRFAEALRTGGGAIISPESAALFREAQDVDESGLGWWMPGTEWGLSVAQLRDPDATDWLDVEGNYYWSGGASTYFWIDPVNEMTAMMFTQVERNGHPNTIKSDIRNLVYSAFDGAVVAGR